MTINRRSFLAASAGALVASRAQAAEPDFSDLYEAAKKEGEVNWYIAHWRTETAERVAKAFSEAYPALKVNVVRATGQVIYQRLTQDMKAKASNCDVFSSSDLGHYVTLKKAGALLAYLPKNQQFCHELARNFDPEHHFTITDANAAVLCYNPTLVSEVDAPKVWTDVLDAKWINQVATPHPGYSGGHGGVVLAITKLYGWQYFEKLAANKPFVTRSGVEPPIAVAAGERKIGFAPASLAVNLGVQGKPIKTVYPQDGAYLLFGPSSVLSASPRQNAAKLFLEFLLSKTTGNIVTGQFTIPVRTDVTPQPGIARLGETKGITCTPDELNANVPGLIDKWRDTFGV